MKVFCLQNRQKTRSIDLRLLRQTARFLLENILHESSYELGIHLIDATEMARLNETFLKHSGSTDIITFDHRENNSATMFGELFISVDDAVAQAKQFGTSWQSELVRYVVHGILHLKGYDDLEPAARQKMKRAENRLLKQLAAEFSLNKLHRAQSK